MYYTRSKSSGTPNLDFYQNKTKSEPNGDYIDIIHQKWFGDYYLLEAHHGFIQWLFPNTEDPGVNWHASMLSKTEAETISSDEKLKEKVLKSFILMLDFWGMNLDVSTGKISRTKNYEARYDNWMGGHNNLRVTRTLKSLGELGLGKYKKPWVEFLLKEILEGKLKGCSSSLTSFWIPTLNKKEQKELKEIYNNEKSYKPKKITKWVHSKKCIEEASGGKIEEEKKRRKRNKKRRGRRKKRRRKN